MTGFEEARNMILGNVTSLGSEEVSLLDSLGRICAEDVIAPLNLPLFENSAMDGYAVRVADCNRSASVPIAGYIPAGGRAIAELIPGSAIKIMTGAPVPQGCDAIVPLEEADEANQEVTVQAAVFPGQHIRRAWEDVKRGETALPRGTPIRAPQIGTLASLGKRFVQVYRKPLVAILATGDELVEPGRSLDGSKVFDSNTFALAAAVREVGAAPLALGIATDDRDSLRQRIGEGLQADVLVTAAGVSVGDRDLVREILAEYGVKQMFWKVNLKPGKAMAFGIKDGKLVFSLPGNPVSALITFEELVRPALLKMMGHPQPIQPLLIATLQEELHKKPGKIVFARVRLQIAKGKFLAWSSGHQDTGFLQTMCRANGIAMLPAERSVFHAGEEINVHVLPGLQNLFESAPGECELATPAMGVA